MLQTGILCAGIVIYSFYPYALAHTHAHTSLPLQTDVVDDIPTVKFVYIQWVGESVKTMTRAKISTHKGDLEDVFKVSYSLEQLACMYRPTWPEWDG